jgi:predicted RecA/RadA family phage recombinase
MAHVIAAPEMMTAAATDVATIGSNVNAAHMVAAARTTSVIPAAVDEVSTGIAQLFSQHAANYQTLAGQAAAFHDQFVQHLTAGAFSYASIEAALASFLQDLNVSADSFVSTIATLTPQSLLLNAELLLTLPVAGLIVLLILLLFLYDVSHNMPFF